MEALIEDENAMEKGVTDIVKDHKIKHEDDEDGDDEDPPAGPNHGKKTKRRRTKESKSSKKPSTTKETSKGKTLTKSSKTGKFALAKEPVEEPIAEVVMDDAGDDTYDPKITYTTSITKIKAAQYKIKGIEDMVPTLRSTIKHTNDKDAEKGIKHWGERRKLWYRSHISKFSKQNVYSNMAILGVKSLSVKKLHEHGHLEEIMVKRSNKKLYKFKECDFVDLHLNEIKDMLLLAVHHKLFHLNRNVIVDFIVALRMLTRSLILNRRVKYLQLGVDSYQKKLNITIPKNTFLKIKFKEPYTPSYDPQRIIYEDLNKQKRVL
nr:hypothetical protein [Tanacetum cinerariifolium]